MKPRTLLLLAFVALAGAAVAVLPALAAAPHEVKLEVNENCYIEKWPCWNVKANNPENIRQIQPFTIARGGTISFEDHDAEAPTDVTWKGAAPSCTGVPSKPQTGWSGTCTFSSGGEYEFESEGLFNDGTFNYTEYKVTVEAPGGTGTTGTGTTDMGTTGTETTGTGTTGTETTSYNSTGSSSSAAGSGGSQSAGSTGPATAGGPGLLYLGSSSSAFKLPPAERGQAVHGAIDVSQAGAGGRLEVDLLASSASLASAHHARGAVPIGRIVHSSLAAGENAFTVPLDAKARHALRTRHHLALTVRAVITSTRGTANTLTRRLLLRS